MMADELEISAPEPVRYYAADDWVGTVEAPGAVEITREQYHAAIDAIIDGKLVKVRGEGVIFEDPAAPQEPETEPAEPTLDDYRRAAALAVDAVAQAKGYDNAVACASYRDSTVGAWAAEAAAFAAWRDAVWQYALTALARVEAGEREVPTIEAFLDELPAPPWPAA